MEIFQLLRMHLEMCGIEVLKKSPKKYHFNAKNMTVFLLVWVIVSFILILLRETSAFDEITDILYRSVSIGAANILYIIIVWKTSKLCEFIDKSAHTVNASEYIEISESNENIFNHLNQYSSLCVFM